MFLIEGTEKACLIDTGYGVGNLKEYVQQLTDKELLVILTHNHGDHANGSGWFDSVYLNEKDWNGCKEARDVTARYQRFKKTPSFSVYPLEQYAPAYTKSFLNIMDGDTFSLGGITLKVLEVPGHSYGSIMLLLEEDRIMIYGDACGRRVGLMTPKHHASDYLNSLKHLKEYDGSYDKILRSHNELYCPLDILDNVIECCENIVNGTDDKFPVTRHGKPCFSACAVDLQDEQQPRLDHKRGNIFYIAENAR